MKEKFIKGTIILIIGGLITKILSMIIRIITTRIIGIEGIGLYMLIMPTYGLFIMIATLSLPVAISKLVSENKRNNKNVVLGIIPIAMLFNIAIIAIIILLAKPLANNLLQNNTLYYPIIAISITLPFITLSNIIRGYFFGKEQMTPHVISNLFEQIVRLTITIIITPHLLKYGLTSAITGLVLYNIASEIIAIIILIFFLPKNIKIRKQDIKPDPENIKDIFSVSIPTTTGKVITAIGGFLEPIIITYVLLKIGHTSEYITKEYGIISGFIFPMVMLPQFLSGAISQALLPTISKYNSKGMNKAIKRKLYQAITISLIIGLISTIIFMAFPKQALNIMFNETNGYQYLIIAAPIFLLTYIQGPIISTLQALNKSNTIMTSNLVGTILKTITLTITLYLDISMYALLISILIQYLFITIYQYKNLKKVL